MHSSSKTRFQTLPRQAPDLSAQLTFADYHTGRDPAMDLILHYKPGPSIAEIVPTAVEK
jgi:hypothetical protein